MFTFTQNDPAAKDKDELLIEFHIELLQQHGCFMEIPPETKFDPLIKTDCCWTLTWKGYELLISLLKSE